MLPSNHHWVPRAQMRRSAGSLLVATTIIVALIVACSTNQENVCDAVGDCEQGGNSDWVQGCKDDAKLLKTEAQANGCGAALDDFYSCANGNFECNGATSSFPGCEGKQATLDACLTKVIAQTACGELAQKTSGCGDAGPNPNVDASVVPDASVVADASVSAADASIPAACSAMRDCHARCFLNDVTNLCAPTIEELTTFATCASMCPSEN
jgi:hypothetical protein